MPTATTITELRRRLASRSGNYSADDVDALVTIALERGTVVRSLPYIARLRLADKFLGAVVDVELGVYANSTTVQRGRLIAVARDSISGSGIVVLRFRHADNLRDYAASLATVRSIRYAAVTDARELDGYDL